MASLKFSHLSSSVDTPKNSTVFGSTLKLGENKLTLLRFRPTSSKISPAFRLKAASVPPGAIKEAENTREKMTNVNVSDPFSGLKQHFFSFKKNKYLENIEHYEQLANSQSPKFTVIACADSRVCPSNILGFQPGDAFMVRNVANLVPPFETGPSETKAALEFSVNALQVENILVIGHSRCGGIRALMSMEDEEENERSFIRSWVIVGKNARLSTKSVASDLNLDQQCHHCEKESVNHSLVNLLTYPWIRERVAKGQLALHGGYYNFVDCSFEKWTLNYESSDFKVDDASTVSVKGQEFWS